MSCGIISSLADATMSGVGKPGADYYDGTGGEKKDDVSHDAGRPGKDTGTWDEPRRPRLCLRNNTLRVIYALDTESPQPASFLVPWPNAIQTTSAHSTIRSRRSQQYRDGHCKAAATSVPMVGDFFTVSCDWHQDIRVYKYDICLYRRCVCCFPVRLSLSTIGAVDDWRCQRLALPEDYASSSKDGSTSDP